MWHVGQQHFVLVAGRFAFHAVDDDRSAAPMGAGCAKFDPGRKPSAPSSRQSGRFQAGRERALPRSVVTEVHGDRAWAAMCPARSLG